MGATGYRDDSDTHIVREIGLRHLSRWIGKTFYDWKRDVRDDYGSIHERRLYRVLAALIRRGVVRRSNVRVEVDSGGGMISVAYEYFRVKDFVPVTLFAQRCGVCGLSKVTRRSHVSSRMHRWFRMGSKSVLGWPRGANQYHRRTKYDVIEAFRYSTPRPSEFTESDARPTASNAASRDRQVGPER